MQNVMFKMEAQTNGVKYVCIVYIINGIIRACIVIERRWFLGQWEDEVTRQNKTSSGSKNQKDEWYGVRWWWGLCFCVRYSLQENFTIHHACIQPLLWNSYNKIKRDKRENKQKQLNQFNMIETEIYEKKTSSVK